MKSSRLGSAALAATLLASPESASAGTSSGPSPVRHDAPHDGALPGCKGAFVQGAYAPGARAASVQGACGVLQTPGPFRTTFDLGGGAFGYARLLDEDATRSGLALAPLLGVTVHGPFIGGIAARFAAGPALSLARPGTEFEGAHATFGALLSAQLCFNFVMGPGGHVGAVCAQRDRVVAPNADVSTTMASVGIRLALGGASR